MHVEPPRRLRDVAVALCVNPLNMFPAYPVRRHRTFGRRRQSLAFCHQRSYDLALELIERLERDGGRDDLTRAGKKRIRKEKKKVTKIRDEIAAKIGCG